MTEAEWRQLHMVAAHAGVSCSEWVRQRVAESFSAAVADLTVAKKGKR